MAVYRLLYGDLVSGQILGELPAATLSYTTTLNGVGRFDATIALDPDPATLTLPQSNLRALAEEGPIGLWPLDEVSGTTVMEDISGNGRHGVYYSNPTRGVEGPTMGVPRGVYATTSQYAELASSDTDPFWFADRDEFSFEMWVKWNSVRPNFTRILGCEYPQNTNGWWVVYHATLGMRFYRTIGGSFTDARLNTPISTGVWHHIAGTYDGTTMRLYHNGVATGLTATNTSNMPQHTPGQPTLTMFCDPSHTTFADASLAGVVIWDRALSADEIAEHYADQNAATSSVTTMAGPTVVTPDTLGPGRTSVYVERDGVILWGGILWTLRADLVAGTMSISGEGLMSYFRRRHIRTTAPFTAVTGTSIARSLITTAQATTGGDIGLEVDASDWGPLRDRSYFGYERKPVLESIEQLSAVEDGFDFYVQHAWSASGIVNTLVFDYPSTGHPTSYVFAVGRNCIAVGADYDGTNVATTVDALGSGEGDSAPLATVQDETLLDDFPVLETVLSYNDVSSIDTLTTHAQRALTRAAGPMRHIKLEVATSDPPIGSYRVGDLVRVVASHGWLNLDETFRIVELSTSAGDQGEKVNVTLAGTEVFG